MKKVYLLIIVVLLLAGCKQEELEPSNLTLLTDNTSKAWQVVGFSNFDIYSKCNEDDIWVFELFNEDFQQPKFEILDNFISCGQTSANLEVGFWRINNAGNRITLTFGDPTEGFNVNSVFEIIEISESKLVLRSVEEDLYGFSRMITDITLTKI